MKPYQPPSPSLWANEQVFIIGGGPSITEADLNLLAGRITIGVNASAFRVNASALFSLDRTWINLNRASIDCFAGAVYLAIKNFRAFDIGNINKCINLMERVTPAHGLPKELHQITGMNSGFGALNLAINGGCKDIVLLGFDMGYKDKEHWHGGYSWHKRQSLDRYERWAMQFDAIAPIIKQKGIRVLNTCLDSKIQLFPKVPLLEVIHASRSD